MFKYRILLILFAMHYPMDRAASGQEVQSSASAYFELHAESSVYGGQPANWAFAQGADGLIYVGNDESLLIYDGVEWRREQPGNGSIVRSLATGTNGRIFIGLYNNFGEVISDSAGRVSFKSLLPDKTEDFGNVWSTCAADGKVFFRTSRKIYVWNYQKLETLETERGFHKSFCIDNTYYVREVGRGILRYSAGELNLLPGGEYFADDRVYALNPTRTGLIAITRESGSFHITDGRVEIMPTKVDAYLNEHEVYGGIVASDQSRMLATLGGGVVVIDTLGQFVKLINANDEVQDNVVNSLFKDSSGGIWFAFHNNGLARLDYPLALSKYDAESGLFGTVSDMKVLPSGILAATGTGLEYLELGPDRVDRFREINSMPIANSIADVDGRIFVATEGGLFELDGELTPEQLTSYDSQVISYDQSRKILWVGTTQGLMVVDPSNLSNVQGEFVLGVPQDVRSIVAHNNDLWLGIRLDGLMSFHNLQLDNLIPTKYDTTHGLPAGTPQVELIDDEPAFVFEEGFFRFDSLTTRFYIDSTTVPSYASETNSLLDVYQDHDGKIWSVFTDAVYVATEIETGSFDIERHPHLSFKRENISQIFVEESGLVWISSGNELVRYDPSIKKSYELKYPPMVRRVTATRSDSVIFYGAILPGSEPNPPSLKYGENDIRIDFAAPEFNAPEKTVYSYKLDGQDSQWSDWSSKTFVDLNNLREGRYIFAMRAKNSMGYISPEGSYSFIVLPPWYRTWWSFLLFATLFLGLAYLSLKYYLMAAANRRAQEQARELVRERVVNEKLQEANEQLHVANSRLTEVNSLKDEFLATTSHELRTPLTAILGYAAILKEEITGPQQEFVEIIEQSSRRLMHTLNSVLDLAKLRSGTAELTPIVVDLCQKAEDLTTVYRQVVEAQGLNIICDVPESSINVFADEYAVATIIDSLLDNAVKFTDEGDVILSVIEDGDNAVISVKDTGVGMAASFLPKIFDEFRQESDGLSRSHTGNGLGLSVVLKMVQLLDGDISVTSDKGVGTEFKVILKRLENNQVSSNRLATSSDRPPIEAQSEPVATSRKKADPS